MSPEKVSNSKASTHIDFLDGFGQLINLRNRIKELFDDYQENTKNYENFKRQTQERNQQIEELSYQKQEIEQLELKVKDGRKVRLMAVYVRIGSCCGCYQWSCCDN